MSKTSSAIAKDVLEAYDRLVASRPDIERKGAAMPYTSVNGNMFSFVTKEGVVALRLPREERERFLEKHGSKLAEQHGAVLAEYVEVPPTLVHQTSKLLPYFDISFEYASSLKPKPAKKPARK